MELIQNKPSLELEEFITVDTESTEDTVFFDVIPKHKDIRCPECNSRNIVKYGKYIRTFNDLPMFGKYTVVKITDHRYVCRDCNNHFVPDYVAVPQKGRLSQRLIDKINKDAPNKTFTQIAKDNGITVTTVKNVFKEYIKVLDANRIFVTPRVLGIDEVHLKNSSQAVFVDVENALLIEMLPNRKKTSVLKYFESLKNPENVKVITMDMCTAYREAALEFFTGVYIVIDRFHVVQLITNALNGYKNELFKNKKLPEGINSPKARRLLLGNYENLSADDMKDLKILFNNFPELEEVYALKENFREIYKCKTQKDAIKMYDNWCKFAKKYECYKSCINTIERWKMYIFNYFDARYTNGVTECMNGIIKSINHSGKGYTFDVIRAKLLYFNAAKAEAKYHYAGGSTSSSGGMKYSMMTFTNTFSVFGDERRKVYDSGDGVDIFKLKEIVQSNDFWAEEKATE